ncbi:50S ribosomal protein L10 [Herbivorax sp. ANBcel31]|uniref:50S ribosomal protein L10 n=1 Tax=Herbivorax sp. ANBcel31 TaxID=3069754 RepID=UPI0027B4F07C|nr:50S ribosomal protein L10 [Herbivorax sp. ANBcel31]MDQ2086689.1 50S ribosomal protein L10 [Herbivorax sp. ANBcel31]
MPSEKILQQKKEAVKKLSEEIKEAKTIVFADYRGVSVEQDTEMRSALRKSDVEYKVVKNNLVRFAMGENGLSELEPHLKGPTAMAISMEDPVAPAKILAEYAKKNKKVQFKAGIVEGKICNAEDLKAIADLPSKEELIAKAIGGMNAPLNGFVNVLNANIKGLAVALNAIVEKKEKADV